MRIRFMTFNVQHFHPYTDENWDTIDVPAFAEAVRCFQPDILTLNEVRGEGPSPVYKGQISELAGELGFFSFFAPAFTVPGRNGPAGPYGNAILSRFPLLNPEIVRIPDPPERHSGQGRGFETRDVAKADVLLPDGRTVTVLATHFGLNPSERDSAVRTVCGLIDGCGKPLILAGDFNAKPDDPVLDPVRERLQDTARLLRGEGLSHPSDRPTVKIDYVFCSNEWEPVFACVPPLVLSDHRPYVADLIIVEETP